MSAQLANRILIALSGVVILVTLAVVVVGLRSEQTRNVTNEIVQQSPCTAAPGSAACQKTKNESDRARSIGETCIIFKKVGYQCPIGDAKKEVVAKQGSNPSQQPGPSNGGLNGSTNPSVPSTPEQPPRGNDDPQPSPPDPSPPSPPSPAAPKPPGLSVTAPGLGVGVKPDGACVNALGIAVGVGKC